VDMPVQRQREHHEKLPQAVPASPFRSGRRPPAGTASLADVELADVELADVELADVELADVELAVYSKRALLGCVSRDSKGSVDEITARANTSPRAMAT